MAHYFFMAPKGTETPECVERICCSTPFMRQSPRGPMPDAQATWNWLTQQGYRFPPNVAFEGQILNPQNLSNQPYVFCVQTTAPMVGRAPIDALYAQPVGNRGVQQMPPIAGQERIGSAGMYQQLPDAALPSNSDPMLGDIDGAGGTYADIDGNGQETLRGQDLLRPAGPPVHERR